MSHMKDLYYTISEMLLEGQSPAMVAKKLDLPVSMVREVQADMVEFSDEFEGNKVAE